MVNYLRNKAVQVGVGGALNVKGAPADVINGFIIKKHCHISVLKEGMGRKDAVVGFYNGGRNLR